MKSHVLQAAMCALLWIFLSAIGLPGQPRMGALAAQWTSWQRVIHCRQTAGGRWQVTFGGLDEAAAGVALHDRRRCMDASR